MTCTNILHDLSIRCEDNYKYDIINCVHFEDNSSSEFKTRNMCDRVLDCS